MTTLSTGSILQQQQIISDSWQYLQNAARSVNMLHALDWALLRRSPAECVSCQKADCYIQQRIGEVEVKPRVCKNFRDHTPPCLSQTRRRVPFERSTGNAIWLSVAASSSWTRFRLRRGRIRIERIMCHENNPPLGHATVATRPTYTTPKTVSTTTYVLPSLLQHDAWTHSAPDKILFRWHLKDKPWPMTIAFGKRWTTTRDSGIVYPEFPAVDLEARSA